jgi:hypothetical protein
LSNPTGSIQLVNSPAEIARALLTVPSSSYFTDPNAKLSWPLFVAAFPDQPDNGGCVMDTHGMIQGNLKASGFVIQSHGLQLKVRGLNYSGTNGVYPLTEAVRLFLSKVRRQPVMVGSNPYVIDAVKLTSPVVSMGQDEKRRATCSANFLLHLIGV